MKIFIDTNIFFNNWMLKGSHFQLLSKYIANTGHQLIIPGVVKKEVDNKFLVELDKIKREISNLSSKVETFMQSNFVIDIKQLPDKSYDFEKILIHYFPNSKIIPYENVNNETLVEKAILGKRPFRENEKGYRDAVIWCSLIEYIANNKIEDEVVLITNNSSDFFIKDGDEFKLHQDLIEDIVAFGMVNKFTVHNSLKSFITAYVNEELHSFSHNDTDEIIEKYGGSIEKQLEEFAVTHMNNLSLAELEDIYLFSGVDCEFLSLFKSFIFYFWEGTEDPYLYNIYKIEEDILAFEYSFNLRRCTIEFTLNTADYLANQRDIDAQFYNAEIGQTYTIIYAYPRTYFVSSGVLNLVDSDVEQVSIDEVYML